MSAADAMTIFIAVFWTACGLVTAAFAVALSILVIGGALHTVRERRAKTDS